MKKKGVSTPPGIAKWLIRHLGDFQEEYAIAGDIEEVFNEVYESKGLLKAKCWYWFHTIDLVFNYVIFSLKWRMIMIKNYLRVALRNIFKHKGFSLINVTGLAIGMACCILIHFWVQDELNFDRFHKNIDNIFRAYLKLEYSSQVFYFPDTPGPLAPELKNSFPEVGESTRMLMAGSKPIKHGNNIYMEEGLCYVDQAFLEMFTFPLIKGDIANTLQKPFSIVITEEIAKKYFDTSNPLGKTLTIDGKYDFTVTGVLKNIPMNSHLSFDMLVPFTHTRELLGETFESWGYNWPRTYIQLKEGTNSDMFAKKIRALIKKNREKSSATVYLQPLKKIHLFAYTGEPERLIYVYVFSLIAFLVLLIACINFMNLSTARSSNRAKEVGIRKVVGACRSNIIGQFFGESLLLTLLSLFLALILVYQLIPVFNNISGKQLTIGSALSGEFLIGFIGIIFFTGLLSGSYPAFFLSSFRPIKVLKEKIDSTTKGAGFRKALVVIQFSLSVGLIICTSIVYKQLNFIDKSELGYNKDNLLYIFMRGDSYKKYTTIKTELLDNPFIKNVSATSRLPYSGGDSTATNRWVGKKPDQSVMMNTICVDDNYLDVMGMKLVSGQPFRKKNISSENDSLDFILNEEAVRRMGIESPVGQKFWISNSEGVILGVVKDFHFDSLHQQIEPLVIIHYPKQAKALVVRLGSENISDALGVIESVWKKVNPSVPFVYHFLDARLNQLYRSEKRLGTLFQYFTVLAIFIACLGLFGLASFMAENRTREIGIRRVLGASAWGIILLLIKEFVKWVVLSNIIAWPVAYLVMSKWLNNFAYRADISITIFLLSFILSISISILAVSYQSVKAAVANPVNALKYE